MNITILVENRQKRLPSEHGLSLYIEHPETTILFDTGHSDLFIKNGHHLGINVGKNDWLVLSHGHWDHGNGLRFLIGGNIVAHPALFSKRYHNKDGSYIGLKPDRSDLTRFHLHLSKAPLPLSSSITFLGEIPRRNSFESQTTPFHLKEKSDDFVEDDSGIVIRTERGLVIIVGCAHAGICNIVEYAQKITKEEKVYALIGGFHLQEKGKLVDETIAFLKKKHIEKIYPMHCVSDEVQHIFVEEFGAELKGSGENIKL